MNGPVILASTSQTIKRQIEAFADAHAGVAQEQQSVAGPIVASQQFPLDQLIVFGLQMTGQTVIRTWNVVRADQAGQER